MKENVFKGRPERREIFQCLLFLGVGIGLLGYSLHSHADAKIEWVMSPYLFPLLISLFFIVLSSALFLELLQKGKTGMAQADKDRQKFRQKTEWKDLGITVIFLCGYYLAMPIIGFLAAGIIFLAGMFWLLGERRIGWIALLSAGTVLILYGIFHKLLHVMLP